MEGERISSFAAENSPLDQHTTNNRELPEEIFQSSHVPVQVNAVSCGDNDHHNHSHEHHHNHKNGKVINGTKKNSTIESKGAKGGRHIHRLEGKCGHQPVLHQPTGGKPHIDFVIGDS
jgi:hypothetical protein